MRDLQIMSSFSITHDPKISNQFTNKIMLHSNPSDSKPKYDDVKVAQLKLIDRIFQSSYKLSYASTFSMFTILIFVGVENNGFKLSDVVLSVLIAGVTGSSIIQILKQVQSFIGSQLNAYYD